MPATASPPTPGASNEPASARPTLHFDSLEDVLAHVESLARQPLAGLGTWTPAQNIDHVRRLIRVSHEGADFTMPLPARILGRLLRARILSSPIKPGMQTVEQFQPPADITLDEAIAAFAEDARAASRPGAMRYPSPFLGALTYEQWEQLHCRHAEHHFANIVPASAS